MHQIIVEGEAIIKIKKADKISKKMEVFYNPIMKINRDVSIILLNSLDKKNMQIALPLSASGIRGIRFLKELSKGKIKSISFNDYSKKAVDAIKNNLRLNKIKNSINKKIKVYNEDANLFLLNSSGFDYIDIDPFGTSNPFLDAAIKRIARGGILAVTNTDTAALTGTYPNACIRKYWAVAKRNYMMHEVGLRILLRKIQFIGMQYEKALMPIFSYFKDHYFRIFFQCVKGKKFCDNIAAEHGMFNNAGPLWKGALWDVKLVNKMYSTLLKNPLGKSNEKNKNELIQFLKIIKDESRINTIGFYDLHDIAGKENLSTMMSKANIISKIRALGYKAANTHFLGTGIRSDVPYTKLLTIKLKFK